MTKWYPILHKFIIVTILAANLLTYLFTSYSDFPVIIKPHEVRCNASTRSTINCYLRQEHADDWESTWIHSRNDQFVSEITGHIEGNISSIEINYCDYREEGKYKCTWKSATSEYSATAIVMAYGKLGLDCNCGNIQTGICCWCWRD